MAVGTQARSLAKRSVSETRLRAQPRTGGAIRRGVEEHFIQNAAASVCLLLNRRTRTMRVIDFRAGPSHAKRLFVLNFAKQEGMEKVYTLVERDESSTWMKLGFAKEATIPGFYKRSDAFLLGCDVDAALSGSTFRFPTGMDALGVYVDEHAEREDRLSPARERCEKTVATAKRRAKDVVARSLPPVRFVELEPDDARKRVERALRAGIASTAFEPFGRDVSERLLLATGRGGAELVVRAEAQACFGNVFLELLHGARTEESRPFVIAAVRGLAEHVQEAGAIGAFAMTPSDDVALATAFVHAGFKRTGLLENHVVIGRVRKDAIVWARRFGTSAE